MFIHGAFFYIGVLIRLMFGARNPLLTADDIDKASVRTLETCMTINIVNLISCPHV